MGLVFFKKWTNGTPRITFLEGREVLLFAFVVVGIGGGGDVGERVLQGLAERFVVAVLRSP